jgi:hypothetical protein
MKVVSEGAGILSPRCQLEQSHCVSLRVSVFCLIVVSKASTRLSHPPHPF